MKPPRKRMEIKQAKARWALKKKEKLQLSAKCQGASSSWVLSYQLPAAVVSC
jgi:hypothetical protein